MKDHQDLRDDAAASDQGALNKKVTIVVNGTPKRTDRETLSFDDVVAFAFPDPPTGEFICFTMTYRGGGGRKPEGSLVEGGSVKIKEGTVFNVTVTDKS